MDGKVWQRCNLDTPFFILLLASTAFMKRRTVFKHLAAAGAAAWLLPSCVSDPKKVSVALNRLEITADEETLLGQMAEVMIPATDTPGAREVGAHLFAIVMVDDCLSQDEQQKYLKGMRNFGQEVKSVTGKSFSGATTQDRLDMLTLFEKQLTEADEDTRIFYGRTREYIIQGYTSSQHFLTKVKPYELVPGPGYNGCAPVLTETKSIS